MSYNGSGTFNINSAGQPVVTGTVISSTAFNALTADLGTGLSTAITKDGQTVATARIPFAAGINSSLVTDATNTTTGSIITAGGVGIAKALFVGTTANIAGTTTLAGVTATSITDSGLTAGRVTYAGTAGLLQDSANLTFNGSALAVTGTLSATGTATITGKATLNSTAGGSQSSNKLNFTSAAANPDGIYMGNTTGTMVVGIEGSSGGQLGVGTSAYASVVGTIGATALQLIAVNNVIATVSSTGLAVTGTVTATNSAAATVVYMQNTNATTAYGMQIYYSGRNPNNTAEEFIYCGDASLRFSVRSNGGIANYSGNNVNLSDRIEKTNFAPATSYLDKICAIPVQTFNYIDQNLEEDDGLTLGVVAQDVQAVAPELVMESNWAGKDEEPKMRLSIYQTDLQYALMKCIQEQQALITALTTRITALEAK